MSIIAEINNNIHIINGFAQSEVYNWAQKNDGEYNDSIEYLKKKNPSLLEKILKNLPLKPTREDVKKCYEKDLYLGFVATLLWGGFNRDGNTMRYFKNICTLPYSVPQNSKDNSIEKISSKLNALKKSFDKHTLSEIIEEAIGGKIAKGIGYSYASKILYFLGYDLSNPKPIIYDSWMCYAHCALLIETAPEKAKKYYCYLMGEKTKKYKLCWTKETKPSDCYEDFCKLINSFENVAEPDKLESWLFSDAIRNEYCQIVKTFFLDS